MKAKSLLIACMATILLMLSTGSAHAEPLDLTVPEATELDSTEARIQGVLTELSKPCERLRGRTFWAEATSLGTASVALALGGGSFAADGTLELTLRLTGVVLSGVSAGAAYLGSAYGDEYRERCSASAVLSGAD